MRENFGFSYEGGNHLGNVMEVVSDRKISVDDATFDALTGDLVDADLSDGFIDYFEADVVQYSDYYPYGMQQPNRNGSLASFRYGFNGMEIDPEVSGNKNSYDFGARQYDPRLGRWMSRDPLERLYTGLSPYTYVADNPILYIDPTGEKIVIPGNGIEQEMMIKYLMTIYATEPGKKIIETLQNSDDTYHIMSISESVDGREEFVAGPKGGGYIYLNPLAPNVISTNEKKGDKSAIVTLMHELSHADLIDEENHLPDDRSFHFDRRTQELTAMTKANYMRSALGAQNFRTVYDENWPSDDFVISPTKRNPVIDEDDFNPNGDRIKLENEDNVLNFDPHKGGAVYFSSSDVNKDADTGMDERNSLTFTIASKKGTKRKQVNVSRDKPSKAKRKKRKIIHEGETAYF